MSLIENFKKYFIVMVPAIIMSCGDKGDDQPYIPPGKPQESITRYVRLSEFPVVNVFTSGREGINSFRIPTLTTTKQGSLIAACEARSGSWVDKSPTGIAVKRSADGGKTWSSIQILTKQIGAEANMDPMAIADLIQGRVFLFWSCWQDREATADKNQAYMVYSDDDGITWSEPREVTKEICPEGSTLTGFGPGSGFQMKSKRFPNRLIMPARIYTKDAKSETRTIYSDDHGKTWQYGSAITPTSELQMAEVSNDALILNMRNKTKRRVSYSYDGGVSWAAMTEDAFLVAPTNGCQGSVLGCDSVLFFTCPAGGALGNGFDDRYDMTLWRSLNDGKSWGQRYIIDTEASGYSCLSALPDGSMAMIYETASTRGFINTGGNRPEGWMRLDVMIIPADVRAKECWIQP